MELKDAMDVAKKFVEEVSNDPENVQLEEVGVTPDRSKIEVVYSFNRKLRKPNSLQKALGIDGLRSFKKIVLDKESGEVLGMYNWTYEARQAA